MHCATRQISERRPLNSRVCVREATAALFRRPLPVPSHIRLAVMSTCACISVEWVGGKGWETVFRCCWLVHDRLFPTKLLFLTRPKVVSLLVKVNMNNMAPVYRLVTTRMSATIAPPLVVVDDVPEDRRIDGGMVGDERGHQPFDVPERTKRIRKVERT